MSFLGSYSHSDLTGRRLLVLISWIASDTSYRKPHSTGSLWALAQWVSACSGCQMTALMWGSISGCLKALASEQCHPELESTRSLKAETGTLPALVSSAWGTVLPRRSGMELSSLGLWPLMLACWSLLLGECVLALGVRDTQEYET